MLAARFAGARAFFRGSLVTGRHACRSLSSESESMAKSVSSSAESVEPIAAELDSMTPRGIVEVLDKHIIGQKQAKRACQRLGRASCDLLSWSRASPARARRRRRGARRSPVASSRVFGSFFR